MKLRFKQRTRGIHNQADLIKVCSRAACICWYGGRIGLTVYPGWPKTHCASTSRMLGLNAYTTMPGLHSQPSVTLTTFHVHSFIFSPTTHMRESLHLTAGSPGAQMGCYIPLVYLMVLLPSWSRQESEPGTPQPQVCDLGTMLLHRGAVFC